VVEFGHSLFLVLHYVHVNASGFFARSSCLFEQGFLLLDKVFHFERAGTKFAALLGIVGEAAGCEAARSRGRRRIGLCLGGEGEIKKL
jgi:hypothetical protein